MSESKALKASLNRLLGGEEPRNPYIQSFNSNLAFDNDQVRACFRYIKSQIANIDDKNNKSFIKIWFGDGTLQAGIAANAAVADTTLSVVRATWATEDQPSYLQPITAGPNDPFVKNWDDTFIKEHLNFKRQIAFEAEMWGLNLNILKACFLGYAVIMAKNWSPYFKKMVQDFIGYHGNPLYPPSNANTGFVNINAANISRGGSRRYSRRYRGKRRRRYY